METKTKSEQLTANDIVDELDFELDDLEDQKMELTWMKESMEEKDLEQSEGYYLFEVEELIQECENRIDEYEECKKCIIESNYSEKFDILKATRTSSPYDSIVVRAMKFISQIKK